MKKNLVIRPLNDPAMKRQIRLVSRAKYPRAKAVEAFGKLVKASMAEAFDKTSIGPVRSQ